MAAVLDRVVADNKASLAKAPKKDSDEVMMRVTGMHTVATKAKTELQAATARVKTIS